MTILAPKESKAAAKRQAKNIIGPPAFWEGPALDLVRRTVAKNCNNEEFDLFIHVCRAVKLDPLRQQIYAFVYNKQDPKKRQMAIVTSIGGYRTIAERTGNYRPDEKAPRIEYDKTLKSPSTNPLGIVRAEVTVHKYSHGHWHPVTGEAYWDECVPLYNGQIDSRKQGWSKSPRVMLPKCAEASALRKAWPDDYQQLYIEDEFDRASAIDITPSEAIAQSETDRKLLLAGGRDAIPVDWCDGRPVERVPQGQFGDCFIARMSAISDPEQLSHFWRHNRAARIEFKARVPNDYFDLQRGYENLLKRIEKVHP